MTEIDKVIRGFESCVGYDRLMLCSTCPYHTNASKCVTTLMRDAHALLKERMPRVMTIDEIYACDEGVCLYYQCKGVFDGNVLYISSAVGFYVDLRAAIHLFTCDPSLYGSLWRCWTSRPTPDQMRETKWDAD